ncbi:hypothetical protein GCM10009668_03820 [Nocardioides dubius]|uniref:Uncharacterized protein n=1 Tax=Nocardioides dubius TaxID=317019 RepID=A0ABN1TKR3_9ACTN
MRSDVTRGRIGQGLPYDDGSHDEHDQHDQHHNPHGTDARGVRRLAGPFRGSSGEQAGPERKPDRLARFRPRRATADL